ncbi:MAG: hypothetical protein CMH54_00295 [Myxococcales bacterium]|nr:hypothetical protein [Myxococcales bacterium]
MRYLAIYLLPFLVWVGSACSTAPAASDVEIPDVGGPDVDSIGSDVSADPVWVDDVEIVLIRACGGCHGFSGCAAGSCFLDDFSLNLQQAESEELCGSMTVGACHVETIKNKTMPPGGCELGAFDCLTQEEVDRLEAWVAAGMPED